MKSSFLPLVFTFCLTATLPAQEDAGEERGAKEAKGRVASFVCTSLPDSLENPVTVLADATISQVVLSKLSPSAPIKVPEDGLIRIVRKVENPEDPGKPMYQTLAQAVVPANLSKALVILAPAVNKPDGPVFLTKVLDLDTLQGGDCLFLNMTTLRIAVDLGKTRVQIEPGQLKTHNPLGASNTISIPIRLSYFQPERAEWTMITASTVALYSTRREMCIFIWDSRFNRVDYESITLPTL